MTEVFLHGALLKQNLPSVKELKISASGSTALSHTLRKQFSEHLQELASLNSIFSQHFLNFITTYIQRGLNYFNGFGYLMLKTALYKNIIRLLLFKDIIFWLN